MDRGRLAHCLERDDYWSRKLRHDDSMKLPDGRWSDRVTRHVQGVLFSLLTGSRRFQSRKSDRQGGCDSLGARGVAHGHVATIELSCTMLLA